jgi:hypothetical protein
MESEYEKIKRIENEIRLKEVIRFDIVPLNNNLKNTEDLTLSELLQTVYILFNKLNYSYLDFRVEMKQIKKEVL